MDRNRILSSREVEGLVAEGHLIVIYEDFALKLDSWIEKHPGGHLAIHHMVGRDATDEINVYHFERTLKSMAAFRIGKVQQPWTNLEPPIRGGVHRRLSESDDDLKATTQPANLQADTDTQRNAQPETEPETAPETEPETDTDSAGDNTEVSSLFSAPPGALSSSSSSVGADDDESEQLQADPTKEHRSTSTAATAIAATAAKREWLAAGDAARAQAQAQPQAQPQDHAKDHASAMSACRLRRKAAHNNLNITSAPANATAAPSLCKTPAAPFPTEKLSRETYTAALEQKEIADGIRNYPSLDPETQQAIRAEYKALHKLVQDQGHYQCRYSEYGKEMIRYTLLFSAFLYLLRIQWYLTSACFLGMFWQQIMFVAHDAGHRGITGDFIIDTVIGAFVADFCNGLSIGWWKSSHNVHHLVTNMPEHDPDNQNVPLFATGPTYFKSIYSSFYKFRFIWDKAADVLVPWQKYTYYPIMCIARFNLYLLSWTHLLSPRASQLGSAWWTRYLEVAFMACFWAIFGYGLLWCTLPDWPTRVGFVLISHSITMLLHVQITLSHWGMPTSDLGPSESFPQRQLRTTMDVACPEWLDFFHGGLQFQAVHHLFPRVPRHNLRRCQKLVMEFCEKTGIKYQCHGFVDGNKLLMTRLDEVARMVETLVQCQTHMAETGHYELE